MRLIYDDDDDGRERGIKNVHPMAGNPQTAQLDAVNAHAGQVALGEPLDELVGIGLGRCPLHIGLRRAGQS
jgi:hypothetical protein